MAADLEIVRGGDRDVVEAREGKARHDRSVLVLEEGDGGPVAADVHGERSGMVDRWCKVLGNFGWDFL